jgi:hypothetical protein
MFFIRLNNYLTLTKTLLDNIIYTNIFLTKYTYYPITILKQKWILFDNNIPYIRFRLKK